MAREDMHAHQFIYHKTKKEERNVCFTEQSLRCKLKRATYHQFSYIAIDNSTYSFCSRILNLLNCKRNNKEEIFNFLQSKKKDGQICILSAVPWRISKAKKQTNKKTNVINCWTFCFEYRWNLWGKKLMLTPFQFDDYHWNNVVRQQRILLSVV